MNSDPNICCILLRRFNAVIHRQSSHRVQPSFSKTRINQSRLSPAEIRVQYNSTKYEATLLGLRSSREWLRSGKFDIATGEQLDFENPGGCGLVGE